jgi:two-component system sensor histidine kinase LytS
MTTGILLITLIERFGLMVAGAFMLLSISPVQKLRRDTNSPLQKSFCILFFGLFGILGTYSGNAIFESVANLRAMAVITAGLFGGPAVGLGAGLMAGLHRNIIDPGGFSALPCGLATVLEGLFAGLVAWRVKESMDWRLAAMLGLVGETVHMILVLALSRPFPQAVELVKVIGMPMIVVNSLGAALFVQIINLVSKGRERRESSHAEQILSIANQTVSHLRSGLNRETAAATARIIYDNIPRAAVSITDTETVLAHIGAGDTHHLVDKPIQTEATRRVLHSGQPTFLSGKRQIACGHPGCPLNSAIIIPLRKGDTVTGTLKFYGSQSEPLDSIRFEIAKGLGGLFSTQLELEDIHLKARMLAHAEIRRLQAQINPHFLFNSLNTIASFCRTNPDKARELLLDLSRYMRRSLDSSRGFVPLYEELEQVASYLAIEQARFGDRVRVDVTIEPDCTDWPIPPLIIQPIVENGVRHGIARREEGGVITLQVGRDGDELAVRVADNGVGMDEQQVQRLLARHQTDSHSSGIGVTNCRQRLEQIFGPRYTLNIHSRPGEGTEVAFRVPKISMVQ